MFQAARRHLRAIGLIGVASALVVAGVAAAQGDSGGDGRPAVKRAPAPPLGIGMKGLTYAELHVRNGDGESETLRVDQGKVKSVDSGSITLAENDGNEVTIPVDADTDVLGKPGQETKPADLEAGRLVNVTAPEGEAAKAIVVLPRKGDVARAPHSAPMPPPPGAGLRFERSAR